jgi:cytochrome c
MSYPARLLKSTLFFFVILLISACGQNNAMEENERPYQPFVFRSVLDQHPRMITIALHDDVWAAYHTDSCSLYKVWKGHVHLQGAVYDNAHGPQPITIGDAWIENPDKHPWRVMQDGQNVLKEVQYKGHAIKNGKAILKYQLICEKSIVISVEEQPEFLEKEGQMGFERVFRVAR